MKNLLHFLIAFFSVIVIQSCGPSQEELKKAQQVLIDSVSKATAFKIEQEQNEKKLEQERLRKDREEKKQRQIDKSFWADLLLRIETEIVVQNEKLEDIKAPKLLRSISTKEEQVRNQLLVIQKLRTEAQEAQNNINKIDKGEEYTSPSSVSLN